MSYTLSELAQLTNSKLIGNPEHQITGVENLEAASHNEAAFLENARYEKQLITSNAGVVFIHSSATPIANKNYLVTNHPSLAFQKVIELFLQPPKTGFNDIHPTAVIHPSAIIGHKTTIGPYVVVDRGVKIGSNCFIAAGVCIGAEAQVGSECTLHPHAIIREGCILGNRVVLQPGAVIGSCGFGYFTDATGKHSALKQLGNVVLEDDVEVGANTTIDRARFKTTRVCQGTKIDNLVQIAHQVEVGKDNLIVSQVGIAGSTKIGQNVVIAGQVGIAGHLTIGNGVMIAAKAGVSKSLLEPGAYSGAPATPLKEFHSQFVQLRNFPKFVQRLKDLESKVADMEKKSIEF